MVREEFFKGNWSGASKLLRNIQDTDSQLFVHIGNLIINQIYDSPSAPTSYYRDLDLSNATSLIHFTIDSVKYKRETFVSAPNQIAVIRFSASQKGKLNFTVSANTSFENATVSTTGENEFFLSGQLPWQINSDRKIPMVYVGENGGNCILRTDTPVKIKGASSTTHKEGKYYLTYIKTKIGKNFRVTAI